MGTAPVPTQGWNGLRVSETPKAPVCIMADPSAGCGCLLRHFRWRHDLKSIRQRGSQTAVVIDKRPAASYKGEQHLIQVTFSGLYTDYSVIFKFKENMSQSLKLRGAIEISRWGWFPDFWWVTFYSAIWVVMEKTSLPILAVCRSFFWDIFLGLHIRVINLNVFRA